MTRFYRLASIGTIGLCSAALAALGVASPASAAPTAQDSAFVMSNEQVNLAEITIGNIALQRASSTSARDLATKTISDHQAAKAKLTTLAAAEHITLPTAPNAQQQSQAATLKSVSATTFDLTYLQIQVAGHQMSIAATNTEISTGSDAAVVAYAKYYLPVATMHLSMAQSAESTLSAVPTAVPAGTGGQAASTSSSTLRYQWGVLGAGVVLMVGAGLGAARRQPRH